jgi:hypothetical protein
MGISNLPLAFKKTLSYHLDLKKYPKSIPHFLGVGDYFSYNEKKLKYPIYIYINVHHINIEVIGKKN